MASASVIEQAPDPADVVRQDRMSRLSIHARAILNLLVALPADAAEELPDDTIAEAAWCVRDMLDELKTLAR